jgi:hypothetical protein
MESAGWCFGCKNAKLHISVFSCCVSFACRSGKVLGWAEQRKSWTHDVFFGWNAAVLQQGTISVGDAVAVIAARA